MLGSLSSELLPTDDSGTPGSRALAAIRAAYACVWADLAMSMSLGTTRRARRRATKAEPRRALRGRG